MGTIEGFQPSYERDGSGPVEGVKAPTRLTLYGTTTSPYTRKARILAKAAGLDVTFVDTRTEEGAARLARVSPLGKVPVLEVEGEPSPRVIPDSGLIAAWLWAHHAPALRISGFDLSTEDWVGRELTILVEGALDAAINRFYLLRDKLPDQGYVTRQADRVTTTLAWLDAHAPAFARPLSAATLSLGCALDWIAFRAMADLSRYPRLAIFREAWAASGVGAGTEPAA